MIRLIFISALFTIAMAVQGRTYSVTYLKSDSVKVVRLLNEARKLPADDNLTLYFARRLKGLPYVAHTLEVNHTEKLIVNLRQLDCTTLVENVTALYLCMKQKAYTFDAFCDNLKTIRYRNGSNPSYPARLALFYRLD